MRTKFLLLAGAVVLLVSCCTPWHMFRWRECAIPIQDDRYHIFLQFKGAHPFLDESFRRVRIASVTGEALLQVHLCTGGCDWLWVFWYPPSAAGGPFLRIKDAHWESVIDLQSQKSYLAYRTNGGIYLGEFEGEYFSMGTAGSVNGESQVMINSQIVPRHIGPLADGPGELLGCVNEEDSTLVLKPCEVTIEPSASQ